MTGTGARIACKAIASAILFWCAGCAQPQHNKPHPVNPIGLLPPTIYLETLDLAQIEQEWGRPRAGRSVDDNPITLAGRIHEHGVGTHANSEWTIDLKQSAKSFHAVVGVDDEVGRNGSMIFVVSVDGEEVTRTDLLRGGEPPARLDVALAGARHLTLRVEDGSDNIHYDHADWADAMLKIADGATRMPESLVPPPEEPPQIAMAVSTRPALHAPRITGATPGRPFLFRIPATGRGPLQFAARGLPDGLSLNPETGIITGSLQGPGTTRIALTVTGPEGRATSELTIVGGQRSLALTPPMGWNSWNVWGTSVDDAKVRAAADWMVQSGLAAVGYQYINIDDAWEGERDASGRIQTNEKFPDMKALADYVHAKGLKLGIYSSPGPKTCAGYEGSYQHEQLDADTFAEWGIDLIKYDWCSYGRIAPNQEREALRRPYDIMRAALDNCSRDIVYSLCQYGMGNVSEWGESVGGNYWRTTGDITDTWSSMSRIGFGQAGLESYAGPGHWNDPDMLVVGQVGWGPTLHPTRLTKHEQVTHITLWSMLAAPLLIGCDLSQMDPFTIAVLGNPEVLAVNQDPLGRQGAPAVRSDRIEIWTRPLADGATAVAIFNRDRKPREVTVNWTQLGLTPPLQLRELWTRTDVGIAKEPFSVSVGRHGAMLLRVRPTR